MIVFLKKISRDLDIISNDALRFLSHCFPPDGGQVGAKDVVSIVDVIRSDRAVLQKVVTYQALEIALGRGCHHIHEATSTLSIFNLMLGESFKVITNGVDVEVMILVVVHNRRRGIMKLIVVHKQVGRRTVLLKILSVKTLFSGQKLNHAYIGEDAKDAIAITTVIVMQYFFASQKSESTLTIPLASK